MSTVVPLTHDEQKAAEAAFHGLPMGAKWTDQAQQIYLGILAVTGGRDIIHVPRGEADGERKQKGPRRGRRSPSIP
jgi:hypothetical protein